MAPILEARDLTVLIGGAKRWLRKEVPPVRAVCGVSLARMSRGRLHGSSADPYRSRL